MNFFPDPKDCVSQRYWYIFFLSSLVIFFVGLFIILAIRCLTSFFYCFIKTSSKKKYEDNEEMVDYKIKWITKIKDYCGEMISGQSISGRILVSMVFFFSLASMVIYFIDVSTLPIECCIVWEEGLLRKLDLGFNLFFMVYFVIRFFAAEDKLWFWLDIYTIVDFFTIPPTFVSIYLNHHWIGLRFLRVLRCMNMPDIFQYLNFLRTSNAIRLTQLAVMFCTIWLTCAGFIHLVENSYDVEFSIEFDYNASYFLNMESFISTNLKPKFSKGEMSHYGISYLDTIYFIVVTMSTVGYGDVTPLTLLGKLTMIIFIFVGIAVFASAIPELSQIIGNRPRYAGSFDLEKGKRHVVVCGYITFYTVSNFLKDFLHKDRECSDIEVVFINTTPPDLELEALFKKNFTQVSFLQGSVMNPADLDRCQIMKADACLILANKDTLSPDHEDEVNILRVIAIKNYHPPVKIIIQLLQYHNKMYLLNIPSWDWKRGDDAVCIAELKLGLLAQSCIVPGFSSLMANLFAMRSFKEKQYEEPWLSQYLYGSSKEMYTEHLSPTFNGKTFTETAMICYTRLNLLLLAVELSNEDGSGSHLAINPGSHVKLDFGSRGFFIAESSDETKRAYFYCEKCHYGVRVAKIAECPCHKKLAKEMATQKNSKYNKRMSALHTNDLKNARLFRHISNNSDRIESNRRKSMNPSTDLISTPAVEEKFDSTGMFHYCSERSFEGQSINPNQKHIQFRNHVIVCVFADVSSPLLGLRNFVLPLRASNYHLDEIKTIILVGDPAFLEKEWKNICNFPNIYVLPGSPNDRSLLRAVNIQFCDMCVIISSILKETSDTHLIDKSSILCSLNIKAMGYDDNIGILGDRYPILPLDITSAHFNSKFYSTTHVPILTELRVDSNVQFLDHDEKDKTYTDLYMTLPFACGNAFAISVLDCIVSTTYFNDNSLTLIRTLITGGTTTELEHILAEGRGVSPGPFTSESTLHRDRPRVTQISLFDGQFKQFENGYFGELFLHCLYEHNMLCWGIYRFIDSENPRRNFLRPRSKRYVICSPNSDFRLIPTDLIYVFQQFVPRRVPSPKKTKMSENEQKNVLRAPVAKRGGSFKRLIVTSNDKNEMRTSLLQSDSEVKGLNSSLNKCFKTDFYDV